MSEWLTKLSQDESLWIADVESFPEPIVYNYKRLHEMAEAGNVYGCLLQIRDIYEMVMKIPVITSLIYFDNMFLGDLIKEHKISEKLILSPLAIGGWYELALTILKADKRKHLLLPTSLKKILEKTKDLYNKRVSGEYSSVANWRNETIGHGMLRLEDNASYKAEFKNLFANLRQYMAEVSEYYESIEYKVNDDEVTIFIDEQAVKVEKYILKGFFLDSFYFRKKNVKYVDYFHGEYETGTLEPFQAYIDELSDRLAEKSVRTDYVRKSEDDLYKCLNKPDKYIIPTDLKDRINDFMETHDKGVLTICMERGMGKTAFANSIAGFYELDGEGLIDDAIVHTYCLSATDMRGTSDFFGNLNFSYANAGDDALRSSGKELPTISIKDKNPKKAMADFLSAYSEIYRDEYDIERLVLVIDGIDELNDETEGLYDWMIGKDADELLSDGVYIIYTTRFPDEGNVTRKDSIRIQGIMENSDEVIEIHRDSPENIQVLKEYLNRNKGGKKKAPGISEEEAESLIKKADYRFLYLKIFAEVGDVTSGDLSGKDVIREYLDRIFKNYDTTSRQLAVDFLTALAVYEDLLLDDYFDFISVDDLTYRFIGVLNDLSPLLSVYGVSDGRSYRFANVEYAQYILENYKDELLRLGKRLEKIFCTRNDDVIDELYDYDTRLFYALVKSTSVIEFLRKKYGLRLEGEFIHSLNNLWQSLNYDKSLFNNRILKAIRDYSKTTSRLFYDVTNEEMADAPYMCSSCMDGKHSHIVDMYTMDPEAFDAFIEKVLRSDEKAFDKWFSFLLQLDSIIDNVMLGTWYTDAMEKVFDKAEREEVLGPYTARFKPRTYFDEAQNGKMYVWTYTRLLEMVTKREMSHSDMEIALTFLAAGYAIQENRYNDGREEKSGQVFRKMQKEGYEPQLQNLSLDDMQLCIQKEYGWSNEEILQQEKQDKFGFLFDQVWSALRKHDVEFITDPDRYVPFCQQAAETVKDDYEHNWYREFEDADENSMGFGGSLFYRLMMLMIPLIKNGSLDTKYFDWPIRDNDVEMILHFMPEFIEEIEDYSPEIMYDWLKTVDDAGGCDSGLYYNLCFEVGAQLDRYDLVEKHLYNYDSKTEYEYIIHADLLPELIGDARQQYLEDIRYHILCSMNVLSYIEELIRIGNRDRLTSLLKDLEDGCRWLDEKISETALNAFSSSRIRKIDRLMTYYESFEESGLMEELNIRERLPLGLDEMLEGVIQSIQTYDKFLGNMNFLWFVDSFRTLSKNHPSFEGEVEAALDELYYAIEAAKPTFDDNVCSDMKMVQDKIKPAEE